MKAPWNREALWNRGGLGFNTNDLGRESFDQWFHNHINLVNNFIGCKMQAFQEKKEFGKFG